MFRLVIIGLTGKMGAGKGEIAAYLEKKGFVSYRFSDIIREEAQKREIEPCRENLQILGNKMREESKNPGILARILVKKIKGNAVVDGIRNRKEIEELRKAKKFVLIGVDAPLTLRYDRLKNRARPGDPQGFEEFKISEERENHDNPKGQELGYCMKQADYIVINTGAIQKLYKEVDAILSHFKLLS